MKSSFFPVLLAALALAPLSLSASATPTVFPEPQEMKLTGGMLTLSSSAKVVGADKADADAVKLLRARLALAASAGDITEVRIGKVGDAAVKGFDQGVPAKSGAYRLVARKGVLALVGHDARGTAYALQTLRQLLDADTNPADLPAAEVLDFPVVPFRGIVEGFYGIPEDCWNHENRLSLITFCGRHKMDT
jgi:hyaluronoglucosaminidase